VTTPSALAHTLQDFVVDQVERLHRSLLDGWQPPTVLAGHPVGPDVRADLAFTLAHLRDGGVTSIADDRIDDAIGAVLRPIDGPGTHTFFSYRVAETVGRFGSFEDNALLDGWTADERGNLATACDSTDWIELLDAAVLPANYAAVLARCELARRQLGLPVDPAVLDDLVERANRLLAGTYHGMLDDDPKGGGRYDIYSLDLYLFCEPFSALLPTWSAGLDDVAAVIGDLAAGDGTPVAWGRSTGLLGLAHTIELVALLLERSHPDAGRWLARGERAAASVPAWFGDGLTRAHQHRSPYGYRGPARRLQLTLDVLGKLAWAAHRLDGLDPPQPPDGPEPHGARLLAFDADRAVGAWAVRTGHLQLVVPFVGPRWSDYLPAPRAPGTFEVPVDRPIACGTPVAVVGDRVLVAAGIPTALDVDGTGAVTASYDGFAPMGIELVPGEGGPPPGIGGTRRARFSVDRRTVTVDEHLTFDTPPRAVVLEVPEATSQPLVVEVSLDGAPSRVDVVDTAGIKEWRSFWGELPRVHHAELPGASELRFTWRTTPALRIGSDAAHHWYHRSLYDAMRPWATDRTVHRPEWERADAVERLRALDCFHLHWPEWVFDTHADAARHFVHVLRAAGVRLVWTQHNLFPHRDGDFAELYEVIAAAADGVIHHSEWGRAEALATRPYRDGAAHVVIPHGHWAGLGVTRDAAARAATEAALGLTPAGLRLGIVGAPRPGKDTVGFVEAFARSRRDDLQLLVLCLEPGDEALLPADPRITALPYEFVDRTVWNERLAAIDVLVFPFTADTRMLTTGVFADAVGSGLPSLVSGWGFLAEVMGAAGIPMGDSPEEWTAAVDALDPIAVEAAARASVGLQATYDWSRLAGMTRTFIEDTVAAGR
jgi:hypothetical protein